MHMKYFLYKLHIRISGYTIEKVTDGITNINNAGGKISVPESIFILLWSPLQCI